MARRFAVAEVAMALSAKPWVPTPPSDGIVLGPHLALGLGATCSI